MIILLTNKVQHFVRELHSLQILCQQENNAKLSS